MNPTHRPPDPAELLRAAMSESGERPAPWTPPTLAELAAAFPELAIHGLVGQGGMAAVYRAEQTRLGRTVALKVMRPDLASQPQFAERFLREARALATLANPHVLAIHDFGERQGFCYLLTEFVDGANLRELMRLGTLSPAEVLRIVPQICAGLHFAHQHGVVHRDIKPENVLVDRAGMVKLADFGLAKLASEPLRAPLTGPATVFGTPHYMAPEQWQGSGSVDHRADIYSLGVVLYELLTGKLPVGTYAPASRQPGVPTGIDQVVQRTLQPEPEQRYQSVREVQRDLERQQTTSTAPAAAAVPPRSALPWLLLTLGIVGAAVTAVAWLVQLQMHSEFTMAQQRAQTERALAVLLAIQTTVEQGKPWSGELPAIDPMPLIAALPNWLVPGLQRPAVAAVALLFWLCSLAAFLRARHPAAPRWQYVVALVLVTSPLTIGLGAVQWVIAMRYARETAGILPFVAMFVIAAGAVAGLNKAWLLADARTAPAQDRLPRLLLAAIGLLLLTVFGGATYVVTEIERPAWSSRAWEVGPVAARRLAGMTRQQVLTRMGPPLTITRSPGAMIWGYRGLDGQERSDAVQFTHGQVTMVTDDPVLLVPNPTPNEPPYLGQDVSEVIAVLGAATDRTTGSDPGAETVLSWRNEVAITVSGDGIVVGVHR